MIMIRPGFLNLGYLSHKDAKKFQGYENSSRDMQIVVNGLPKYSIINPAVVA